jgi:hypothetical protein
VPNASDKGMVTVRLRPIDSVFLSFESAEHVVCMVFDYMTLTAPTFQNSA